MPCIPPGSRVSGNRFPPKTAPGPPDDGSHADSRPFILAREFPRFRDPRAWTAYAGERIAPLFPVTIPRTGAACKRKTLPGRRKNNLGRLFFEGGQVCWSSFTDGKRDNSLRDADGMREARVFRGGKRADEKAAPRGWPRMRRETCFERLAPRPYRGGGNGSRYSVQLISA